MSLVWRVSIYSNLHSRQQLQGREGVRGLPSQSAPVQVVRKQLQVSGRSILRFWGLLNGPLPEIVPLLQVFWPIMKTLGSRLRHRPPPTLSPGCTQALLSLCHRCVNQVTISDSVGRKTWYYKTWLPYKRRTVRIWEVQPTSSIHPLQEPRLIDKSCFRINVPSIWTYLYQT